MRSFIHFVKYNNTFPLLLFGLLLGAGAVFAATSDGSLPLSSQFRSNTPKAVPPTDISLLLKQDLSHYQMKVRIKNITETSAAYQVQYSFNTLDIVDGKWQETQKEKTITVQKEVLGKQALADYLAEQISQVTKQEMAYLTEVQSKVSGSERQTGTPNKYIGLIGRELALESGSTKEQKADSSESSSKNKGTNSTNTPVSGPSGKGTPSTVPGVSEQELRQLIVQAVADFLAIDTTPIAPLPETGATSESGVNQEEENVSSDTVEGDVSLENTPSETESAEGDPTQEPLP